MEAKPDTRANNAWRISHPAQEKPYPTSMRSYGSVKLATPWNLMQALR
jgi:hypothetical protein